MLDEDIARVVEPCVWNVCYRAESVSVYMCVCDGGSKKCLVCGVLFAYIGTGWRDYCVKR